MSLIAQAADRYFLYVTNELCTDVHISHTNTHVHNTHTHNTHTTHTTHAYTHTNIHDRSLCLCKLHLYTHDHRPSSSTATHTATHSLSATPPSINIYARPQWPLPPPALQHPPHMLRTCMYISRTPTRKNLTAGTASFLHYEQQLASHTQRLLGSASWAAE